MAIYTRYGTEVTLCDARLIPVWIVTTRGSVKWHYAKPKRGNAKLEEMPMWHYRGWHTETGTPVCDNKWVSCNSLVADDGLREIHAKLMELCPDGEEKFKAWNKKDAPDQLHFFPQADEKEIA